MTPSVTQILMEAGLIDAQWFTEESRGRGSEVHRICQLYDEGEIEDDSDIDEALRGYFMAYLSFRNDFHPVWSLVEATFSDPQKQYHGTVDRYGMIMGSNGILDIKSGGKMPWHPLQLSAYAHLLNQSWCQRYTLRLQPDGKYKLDVYDRKTFRVDLEVFFAALKLYQWRLTHGKAKHTQAGSPVVA